jgi:predicted DNA-binding transcriptional regulator YafY
MKVRIDYTNWKGERAFRIIQPLARPDGSGPIFFSSGNEWHPAGWMLNAYDWEKKADRTFAMDHIHSWENYEDSGV